MPPKPQDELLGVVHLLSKAARIIGEQEARLGSLAREYKSSVTLEEFQKVAEERDNLQDNLNQANERVLELENQLSSTLKEFRSHRDAAELTSRLKNQALAEAREEANRWHEQCTRIEQAREVRASQIDALIQALHERHTSLSQLYHGRNIPGYNFLSSEAVHCEPAAKTESDMPGFGGSFNTSVTRPSTSSGDVNDPRTLNTSFRRHSNGRQAEAGYYTGEDHNDSEVDEMAIIPSSRRKRTSDAQTIGHALFESSLHIPSTADSVRSSKKRKAPQAINSKKAKR
ncbi:uncharacterized protein EI90DRAFT_3153730 [Cantharellus anzutake]|uniref:uncharacterized protein n=1 Tax=Cantharellus anzutake TaxID=1750568 RepID=UPI0019050A3C|nr:uncharacterized protein EI90DRAFT_3153730 [Cantharellus anzutake]KAF8333562.1 hypothetical protein EI90DRAFT_3153730 [Cantharellus anzutake]